MRILIQRVERACVRVADQEIASIGAGYLLLLGIQRGDEIDQVDKAVAKLLKLRLFEDEAGKTNLNLAQVGGSILLVSQFTLAANLSHGNRPSFDSAAAPQVAESLYLAMADGLKKNGITVETGRFGADMKVELVNDGPATYSLEIPPNEKPL